jgi:hypothetical protein
MKIDYLPILQNFLDLYYQGDSYKLDHDVKNSVFYLYVLPNWNFVSKLFYIKVQAVSSAPSNLNIIKNEELVTYIENSKTTKNPYFLHSHENKLYTISFSDSVFYELLKTKAKLSKKKL